MKGKSFCLKIKSWAENCRNSSNPCLGIIGKMMFKIASVLRTAKRCITDKEFRSVTKMQFFHPKKVHQTSQVTFLNRYPEIFSACKQYFQELGRKEIKILSFGCCTGEEVITLRAYFPDAFIIGADINTRSLKICKQRNLDEKILFIKSSDRKIKKAGPFDAVFCMAVLQRTPHVIEDNKVTSLKEIYPFEKFAKQTAELDAYVKKDGLLVVHITQYDFADTDTAVKYIAYGDLGYSCGLFDKDSRLVDANAKRNSIFIKNQ